MPTARCTNRRSSAGIAASSSSRITDPRRRRLSTVSNSRTRSSASSSISISQSRMTRNAPCPLTRIAGEEPSDEQAGRLLERDDPRSRGAVGSRQSDEALDLVGNADERIHGLAIAGTGERERDREAEIGDERKRMRRVDGERRKQREDLAQEVVFQPGPFLSRHLRPVDQHDALLGQHPAELEPALLLVGRQCGDRFRDAAELLGRREAVGRFDRDPGAQLALEAGDADHEELIEIVGRNREEPHPLQQGVGLVRGLFEHAAVEVEPGQLTVDETLGAGADVGRRLGRRPDRGTSTFLLLKQQLGRGRPCFGMTFSRGTRWPRFVSAG